MGLTNLLLDVEMYTVRVLDEAVYVGINKAVERIEPKGVPRKRQAEILSCTSAMLYLGNIGADALRDIAHSASMEGTSSLPSKIAAAQGVIKSSAVYTFFSHDYDRIQLASTANPDGTLPASYQSLGGIARPYVLSASLAAIAHGFTQRDMTTLAYGTSTLPYALSLYVRDASSGGLLESIKNDAVSFFRGLALDTRGGV